MSFTRIFVAALILSACAQGQTDADTTSGTQPKKSTSATDPGESVTVPSQTPPDDTSDPPQDPPADDDASTPPVADSGSPVTDSGAKADSGSTTCAKTPPSNACGLAPQCGCGSNQTCDITNKSTGAVSCVGAGAGAAAAPCTSTSQCGAGLTCAYGACRPYCSTTCSGGTCEDWYEPAGTLVPNGKVCSITCDLRNPSAACGTNNCIFDGTITDCDKSGTLNMYDACSSYDDCKQGLACINHPVFGYECEKWCRLGQNDCSYPDTCTDVYGAAAPSSGGVKLGHCQ